MADKTLEISIGGQSLGVSFDTEQIDVAVVNEVVHVNSANGQIRFSIKEEKLNFSSPLVLAASSGWPFGPNPNKVEDIVRDVPTIVDQLAMPSHYRVAKWLILISDDASGLAVTSEIKCMRQGGNIYFIEYAILGDSGLIPYELDVVDQGNQIQLVITSRYHGVLTVRTSKLGIFN
ncbi:MAG: hypothetical protein HQL07_03895 [Nitrospirae bacterium]|nr:hypothetical protein [Magnetococcales bacterium]HAT48863.1 hypothetical protein [Alphaproteobacteria bacterium]